MKLLVFAVALLVAGASAFPQLEDAELISKEQRLITNTIRQAIREIQKTIVESGLDPLLVKDVEYTYNIPLFVRVRAYVERLDFTGASDIKINTLDYSVLLSRLRFDLELPHLALFVTDSGVEASILGTDYDIKFKGRSSISRIRLAGEVRVNIGIISGISIRSLSIEFSVADMSSDITLIIFGQDLSPFVNEAINDTIPEFLTTYRREINQALTDIVRAAADAILG